MWPSWPRIERGRRFIVVLRQVLQRRSMRRHRKRRRH
jgi:hypothetical protein